MTETPELTEEQFARAIPARVRKRRRSLGAAKPDGEYEFGESYLIVSLGEPKNDACYKLLRRHH